MMSLPQLVVREHGVVKARFIVRPTYAPGRVIIETAMGQLYTSKPVDLPVNVRSCTITEHNSMYILLTLDAPSIEEVHGVFNIYLHAAGDL